MLHPVTGQKLSWAVTAAGIAQCLWLAWSCRRVGLKLGWPHLRISPEVRRLMRIMLPGVFGAGATQINLAVSTAIASLAPVGSVSYLAYADRLNQLPLGVVGVAVATAILPTLSRHIRKGEDSAALHTQNRGLELALLLTLPAAVALLLESHAILHVLFQRGHFGPHQVAEVAPTLAAYAFGLPAFVLTKVVITGFLARQDTLTPVKVAVAVMVANLVLTISLGLYSGLAHVGIALATSTAGWINALTLMAISARRLPLRAGCPLPAQPAAHPARRHRHGRRADRLAGGAATGTGCATSGRAAGGSVGTGRRRDGRLWVALPRIGRRPSARASPHDGPAPRCRHAGADLRGALNRRGHPRSSPFCVLTLLAPLHEDAGATTRRAHHVRHTLTDPPAGFRLSYWAYSQAGTSYVDGPVQLPDGFSYLTSGGADVIDYDQYTGLYGAALVSTTGQVVVAFEGTNLYTGNDVFTAAQSLDDTAISYGGGAAVLFLGLCLHPDGRRGCGGGR